VFGAAFKTPPTTTWVAPRVRSHARAQAATRARSIFTLGGTARGSRTFHLPDVRAVG
jgi:hypothetical protein